MHFQVILPISFLYSIPESLMFIDILNLLFISTFTNSCMECMCVCVHNMCNILLNSINKLNLLLSSCLSHYWDSRSMLLKESAYDHRFGLLRFPNYLQIDTVPYPWNVIVNSLPAESRLPLVYPLCTF